MIDTTTLTITQAAKDLREKKYSALDLCRACVDVIEKRNPELNAILEVFSDWEAQAKEADAMISKGDAPELCGIPIVLKDNILFAGHIASAGAKILEPYVASYSATGVESLRKAGAVILGRANMDEAAMGSSTENSAFGPSKNPYDTTRVPGGSSGGSAVAVATGMCLAALGTDTAGSVRQPAGFCGVVGYKPTYGGISRYGIIAMGNSLDQIGVFAKNVKDTEIVEKCLVGFDARDAQSIILPEGSSKEVRTIGVPWSEIDKEGIAPEVLARFKEGIEKLRASGYTIKDIELPKMKYSIAAYYTVMPAEVSTNLSRLDGIRYGLSLQEPELYDVYAKTRAAGFGPETRRRIMLGTYVLSHGYYDAYYRKAVQVRESIKEEFSEIFKIVDVIATPTSPTSAFKLGEKSQDPLSMYLADIFTVPANIVGIPAISMPNGKDSLGLPLDLQFMADAKNDKNLLAFSEKVEEIILS